MNDSYNRAIEILRDRALQRMKEAPIPRPQYELGTLGTFGLVRRYFVFPDRTVTRRVWRADLDEAAIRKVTAPHIYPFEPTLETSHATAAAALMDEFSPMALPPLKPDVRLLLDGARYEFIATNFRMEWNSAQPELVAWFDRIEERLNASFA